MSRLWDMGSRLHTVFTPLSEGLPRLRPDSPFETRLPTAHTSIPPCGRAYPALRKGTRSRVPQEAGPKANRSAEGWSEARRAKRPIYSLFFFPPFPPKNACQASKFPNPLRTKNIRLSYELPSNRYTRYRSKNNRKLTGLRAQLIENTYFRRNPFVMTILQCKMPATH
jgi:hypothetical protein